MIASPRVAAIVLNWNDAACTTRCLEALLAQSPPPLIILCDNGSCDDSLPALRAWLENQNLHVRECGDSHLPEHAPQAAAYLVRNKQNLGYAAGNNPGIRLALSLGLEFVWILNNDARPLDGALSALLACAEQNPEAGIFGSTMVEGVPPRQKIKVAGGCQYHPLTTITTPVHAGRAIEDLAELPDRVPTYIHGACLFARAALFRNIGVLNEIFFLFYEELDLCARARAAGYELLWCRTALVEHLDGHTVKSAPKAHIEYHENLSTVLYTRLHHPYLLFPALAFRLAAKLVFLSLRGHPARMSTVWRAYRDGLRRPLR